MRSGRGSTTIPPATIGEPPAGKMESWRKRSATGAVLTGLALGFQQVFEKEREEPAIIMTTSGDPPRDLPVEAEVEHGRPRRSVVNIRPWLLGEQGGTPPGRSERRTHVCRPGVRGQPTLAPAVTSRRPAPSPKATEMIGRKSTDRGAGDDDLLAADMESLEEPEPGPLRRWWTSLNRAAMPEDAASPDDGVDLKPTTMRRPEPLYGYVVALELIFISILNLVVTHGKGAPAHPATAWSAVGLLAAIAMIPIIRLTNHRLIVAFYTVVATFLATQPRTPSSLAITHFLALGIAIVYAFWLSQRQRKAATARARSGQSGSSAGGAGRSSRQRTGTSGGGRRSRREKDASTGPQASRRYTPPKAKRIRP